MLALLTSAEKEDAHFCSVHLIHPSNTGPFAAITADGGVKIQYKIGFTSTNKTTTTTKSSVLPVKISRRSIFFFSSETDWLLDQLSKHTQKTWKKHTAVRE